MKETGHAVAVKGSTVALSSGELVALLQCSGVYGVGSDGKPDARAIYAEAQRLIVESNAVAVLLDYSELDYQWGDDIWLTLQPDDPRNRKKAIPVAVIPGVKSQDALKSLLEDDGGFDSWLDSGLVFFNLESAVASLTEQVAAAQQGAQADALRAPLS